MLSYIIFASIVILGFINYKFPQLHKWYKYILPVYIIILSICNTYNADYDVYYRIYYNQAWSSLEIGFEFLTDIARLLSINYQLFFSIILIISFYLLYSGINSLIKIEDKTYIYFFYLLYPLMLDITQYRFFLATSIVIYCLKYLTSEKKLDIFKYILGVLIASTIQITALFYILFILYKFPYKKKIFKYSLIFISIILLFLFLVDKNFIIELINNIGISKLSIYFDTHLNFGILIAFYYLLGSLGTIFFVKKELKNSDEEYKFVNLIYELHIIVLFSLPFIYFDFQFLRFWRALSILKYCVYAIYLNNININIKHKNYFFIIICIFIGTIFTYEILYSRFSNVFEFILNNNFLLP